MTEAELVLTHVLNCDRLSLYLNKDARIAINKSVQVSKILKRRMLGEPLQYILGSTEFMGFKFKLDNRALIPRPETEILIGCALERLKLNTQAVRPKVLDLGTGSGCIAISIAKLLPLAQISATDISLTALQLAKENAKLQKVKIRFLRSDIFSAFKKDRDKFDLIISNPPYISEEEFCNLAQEISFEPALALKAGHDGLDFYRRIISQADFYLNKQGLLALEIGAKQSGAVRAMMDEKNFSDINLVKDYNNINRVLIGKKE